MPARSSRCDFTGRLLLVVISLRTIALDTSSASTLVGSMEVASQQLTRCPAKDVIATMSTLPPTLAFGLTSPTSEDSTQPAAVMPIVMRSTTT
jgi:hypothetical protein